MAMQPSIARQNRWGVWPYKWSLRHRISDFFSSATKILPRWLFADAEIRRWNASAAGLDLLQRPDCRFRRSPAAIRHWFNSLTKRTHFSTALLQMPHRHCKMCGSPLHADDTHAEGVSCLGESHAQADCFHWEFSLASLCSRIAFFSESDSFYNLDVHALQARVLLLKLAILWVHLTNIVQALPALGLSILYGCQVSTLRDDTQATDNPMSPPVLGVFYYSPGSYSHVSLGFEPFHVIAWRDCTCSHTNVFDAVRVKYRKGTYLVTIITSVPWDILLILHSWPCCELQSLPSKESEMRQRSHWFVF